MLFMMGYEIHDEISTRHTFQQMYGVDWRAHFEQRFGSVEKAHTRTIVACAGITAITALLWLISRQITGYNSGRSGHRHHRKHRPLYKW
jgi:hypothetical protein